MDVVGTPDSSMTQQYLQTQGVDVAALLKAVLATAPWVDRDDRSMLYRGHQLNRSKFFLMATDDPNRLFKYSYPGWQWASMLHYKPWSAVPELRKVLKQLQRDGFDFNHVIGTLYSEPKDDIGAHSDKMVDIEPDTNIVSLSLGDAREFVLTKDDAEDVTVVLHAGDLFVLGPDTNASMKHAVLSVEKENMIDRTGTGFQPKISIVLRKIHTEYTRAEVLSKIEKAGRDAVKRDAVKAEKATQSPQKKAKNAK